MAQDIKLDNLERSVLVAIAQGLTNARIGVRFGWTEGTTANHVRKLFERFGANSRPNLIHLAYQANVLRVRHRPVVDVHLPEVSTS